MHSIYELNEMWCPVIIGTADGEKKYKKGSDAGKTRYKKPRIIESVTVVDSKIVVELVEYKHFQDTLWFDCPVNSFDGD